MTTPTTENPGFKFDPNDPTLDFPAYETSGHKTYLDYKNHKNEHGLDGHRSEKSSGSTHAPKDALNELASKSWLESPWARVLMWALIVLATYKLYLRVIEYY